MPRLRSDQIPDLIKKSVGHPMRKISAGQSLYLITRNGRGYWSYQWREGTAFRTKVLGSAADLSLTKARHAREAEATNRRNGKAAERRGAANRAAHPLAAMPVAASGEAAGELLSDLLIRYVAESAPGWKSGKALLHGLLEAEIVQLVRDEKAGKEAKSYTTMFSRIPDMMTLPAQSISPLAYRNAVKAIWPENAATVERMMKRLGILLKYQREGKRKKPKARNHEAMPYNDVPSFMAHLLTRPFAVLEEWPSCAQTLRDHEHVLDRLVGQLDVAGFDLADALRDGSDFCQCGSFGRTRDRVGGCLGLLGLPCGDLVFMLGFPFDPSFLTISHRSKIDGVIHGRPPRL
jgi:hypothetical protein